MTLREILAAPPTTGALSGDRQERLTSLVYSIPFPTTQRAAQSIFMLVNYALGVDYISRGLFCKSIKGRRAIAQRKAEMKRGQLTLTGTEEPFEKFLTIALATGKTWEDLIQEHRISKVFIHIESLWHHREFFIIFICVHFFTKEQARFLAFRCIFRTNESINDKMLKIRDSHYYKSRLESWIAKEIQEIDRIEDRLLSLLIQSVKREMNLTATLDNLSEHLNFQWVHKFCELHWLNFLCFQFQYGESKEIFKTCELRTKITWKTFDRHQKPHYNGEVVYRLGKRLQNCLKNCIPFEQYFVDELQVVLLSSIREQVPWSEVKRRINSLFPENTTEKNQSRQNICQNGVELKIEHTDKSQMKIRSSSCFNQQYQKTISGRKRKINEEFAFKVANDAQRDFYELKVTNQQMQTLSLIHKTQNVYNSIEAKSFKQFSSDALSRYVESNRKEMEALAEQKLNYYRENPQEIGEIQHQGTKKLVMSLLAFETSFVRRKDDISQYQLSQTNQHDKQKKVEEAKARNSSKSSWQTIHQRSLCQQFFSKQQSSIEGQCEVERRAGDQE